MEEGLFFRTDTPIKSDLLSFGGEVPGKGKEGCYADSPSYPHLVMLSDPVLRQVTVWTFHPNRITLRDPFDQLRGEIPGSFHHHAQGTGSGLTRDGEGMGLGVGNAGEREKGELSCPVFQGLLHRFQRQFHDGLPPPLHRSHFVRQSGMYQPVQEYSVEPRGHTHGSHSENVDSGERKLGDQGRNEEGVTDSDHIERSHQSVHAYPLVVGDLPPEDRGPGQDHP
jgi:hypothetical protein